MCVWKKRKSKKSGNVWNENVPKVTSKAHQFPGKSCTFLIHLQKCFCCPGFFYPACRHCKWTQHLKLICKNSNWRTDLTEACLVWVFATTFLGHDFRVRNKSVWYPSKSATCVWPRPKSHVSEHQMRFLGGGLPASIGWSNGGLTVALVVGI